MADDKKISQLTTAGALDGSETLEVVQGGANKKTTTQDIADLGGGGVTDGDKGDVVVSSSGTVWTVESASATAAGKVELATPAEVLTGTDTARAATAEGIAKSRWYGFAFSDQLTPIVIANDLMSLPWPYDVPAIQEIIVGLTVAQTAGSIFTVDIEKNGTTILSTLVTIDNNEKTNLTAATPAVISVTTITKGDIISVSVTQVGNGTAIGGTFQLRG